MMVRLGQVRRPRGTFPWTPPFESSGIMVRIRIAGSRENKRATENKKKGRNMDIERREFLQKSAAGVGGVIVGSQIVGAAEVDGETFDPYETVELGKTGIKVSRVGIGTGMRGWKRESNQTRMGREKFQSLLKYCLEQGVTYFDVADLYGTHPYVARAFKDVPREKYVVGTKIWFRQNGLPEKKRPDADVVVERFLKELKTDYIDLVLLHCVTDEKWNEKLADQMKILNKLKKKGVIRAHGVSVHSLPALKTAAKESWVDSVHARINPYGVRMDDKPEKVVPVLKDIREAGKGIVGMKINGEGKFREDPKKRHRSVEYVLQHDLADTMILGFEKKSEVDDIAACVKRTPVKAV